MPRRPAAAVTQRVLGALHPDLPLTAREVARAAHVPPAQVRTHLHLLVQEGLARATWALAGYLKYRRAA